MPRRCAASELVETIHATDPLFADTRRVDSLVGLWSERSGRGTLRTCVPSVSRRTSITVEPVSTPHVSNP